MNTSSQHGFSPHVFWYGHSCMPPKQNDSGQALVWVIVSPLSEPKDDYDIAMKIFWVF